MLDFSIYLLYRAGTAIANSLPLRLLFRIGQLMGLAGWLLLGKYRRLALRNAAIAFGNEKSRRELRRLVRRHFQSLGANIFCSVKMGSMPIAKILRHVETENFEAVHRELRAGRPVILVLSHIGNWEAFAQLFTYYVDYARISTVYRRCPKCQTYLSAVERTDLA